MTQDDKRNDGFSRRRFFKTAGVLGIGAILNTPAQASTQSGIVPPVAAARPLSAPTRPFGRSSRKVSILSLGGMFDIAANQLMIRQAVKWGVTYWDTADCYQSGSETGIGKYFTKYPEDREKVFLVSKSDSREPEGIEALLNRSLTRLNTTYLDLYLLHGISNTRVLTDDVRRWAEKAKAKNKIRLFGFSTHSNMAECLWEAADLDWIDGIMMTYNIRNMFDPEMKRAIEACAAKGIGLTAMKTQAGSSWFRLDRMDEAEKKLTDQLKKKGWTPEQAKLKAVWQSPGIVSICSQMDSLKLLKANVEAAADPTGLSGEELGMLKNYCMATSDQYCMGCGRICETGPAKGIPIGDIMRCHMYNLSYGRPEWAKAYFRDMPNEIHRLIGDMDFSDTERSCPQHMPIGRLMRQALEDFV